MSNIQESILTVEKTDIKRPSLYKIILHNDDYTPMDFVILILEKIFHKHHEDAVRIMLSVHHKGTGFCGIYTYEAAETKVHQVTEYSRSNEHPLRCTMEPE